MTTATVRWYFNIIIRLKTISTILMNDIANDAHDTFNYERHYITKAVKFIMKRRRAREKRALMKPIAAFECVECSTFAFRSSARQISFLFSLRFLALFE